MNYLTTAISHFESDDDKIAISGALISIAQSLATIAAAMTPAPVAEKRPVVEIGDSIIRLKNIVEVNWSEPNSDPDSAFTVWVFYGDGHTRVFEDDKAEAFLQAYRAYCGLEPQAEQAAQPATIDPADWVPGLVGQTFDDSGLPF